MSLEPPKDRSEAARYCAQMCLELRDLAMHNDLSFLAYLFEMARVEAFERHCEMEAACDGKPIETAP